MPAVSRWIVALGIAACVVSQPRMVGAEPQGSITYAMHVTIAAAWFDPAENTGIATPFMVQEALHDALAKPRPQHPMAPSLAESWSESTDCLAYGLVLPNRVQLANAQAITP